MRIAIFSILLLAAPVSAAPRTNDESAAMATVDRMFAGLAARDGQAILAVVRPEGGANVAVERPDGTRAVRHLSWTEFAAGLKPGPEKYREALADPIVRVDGDIAMVWSRYTFFVDGKKHHCGVDHFDLVREAGAWKLLNVTWSQRTTGCS
jgi:hypothetical protein